MPAYDKDRNTITWAFRITSDREVSTNYETRVLGRRGVMSARLIANPNKFRSIVTHVRTLVSGITFSDGHQYAQFVQGDKIARVGLVGLIAGTGTAIAAKTGFLAKFWKVIVGIVAAGIAALRALWNRPSAPEPISQSEAVQPTDTKYSAAECVFVTCAKCGQKNRVPIARICERPKCGRCQSRIG